MLIPLQEIVKKYNLNIKGVIHAGAHWGQEYEAYKECGIERIIFIEPCKDAFEVLKNKFENNKDVVLLPFACGSENGAMVMNVERTNQGQSNSLLQPKLHLRQHPEVIFGGETEFVQVRQIDHLVRNEKYNMLMIDVQGYELEVLKGAKETLNHIDIVYTECNREETYENNPLIEDLDSFLFGYGFERVETMWASANLSWGDCIYLKN